MKFQITLLLLCFSTFILGQSNASIDLIVGVENNYRSVNDGNLNTEIGYRFGLNYNKKLSEKFYLKIGLRAVNLKYQTDKVTGFIWNSEIEAGLAAGTEPIIDPTLPHDFQYFYDYWFLEIPLIGRYEFSDGSWSPFVEIGVSPNLYLDSNIREETEISERNSKGNNINKIQLVASVSFGLNYSVNDDFQAFAQPIFRYHLSKTTDSISKERLYNVGLEVGVRKRLK